MSSEIFYAKAFVRVGECFIPLSNHGASNCFDIDYRGREIPEKGWTVLNYPNYGKILHTREEMQEVARVYEAASTNNRGGTRKSRNRAFEVGEFGRWIMAGMKTARTVEEYTAWGNRLLVMDYSADYTGYPVRTTEELLAVLEKFKGNRNIGMTFQDKRKVYRLKRTRRMT